jgi:hypothetical protein
MYHKTTPLYCVNRRPQLEPGREMSQKQAARYEDAALCGLVLNPCFEAQPTRTRQPQVVSLMQRVVSGLFFISAHKFTPVRNRSQDPGCYQTTLTSRLKPLSRSYCCYYLENQSWLSASEHVRK